MGDAMPALRHDYLTALGIEPLVLRVRSGQVPADGIASHATGATTAVAGDTSPRLQLRMRESDPLAGTHAALLRGLLRALAVTPDEVCFETRDALPVLAFDDAGNPARVHAPALAALRDARAKRALWPALRRLRRDLRGAAT